MHPDQIIALARQTDIDRLTQAGGWRQRDTSTHHARRALRVVRLRRYLAGGEATH